MSSDRLVEQLRELAGNLWWCWQPDVQRIFRDLAPDPWDECNHNPLAVLEGTADGMLVERTDERALASRIRNAHRRLVEYRRSSGPEAHMRAAPLHAAPVAYFCAEFCLHESLPMYSGGLGVLAGDHLKSASDLAIPIVGVGLFYHHGYFDQRIDDNGWQKASQGAIETESTPRKKVRGASGEPLTLEVPGGEGGTLRAHAWRAEIGRNRLYLLDANIEANAPADRELSEQLYGGDRRMRIRQEVLLGVGAGSRSVPASRTSIRPSRTIGTPSPCTGYSNRRCSPCITTSTETGPGVDGRAVSNGRSAASRGGSMPTGCSRITSARRICPRPR